MKKYIASTPTYTRRKLRSFRDVTKHLDGRLSGRTRATLRERSDYSVLQTDETTDLNYFVMSVPKELTAMEKVERLSLFAGKIADVGLSDVICMAIWIPS